MLARRASEVGCFPHLRVGLTCIGRSRMTQPADFRVAVYTGTFDPVHYGHLDVIRRGSRRYDKLFVGVGINPEKAPFFTEAERVQMLRDVTSSIKNVEVRGFNGLAVRFVQDVGARV